MRRLFFFFLQREKLNSWKRTISYFRCSLQPLNNLLILTCSFPQWRLSPHEEPEQRVWAIFSFYSFSKPQPSPTLITPLAPFPLCGFEWLKCAHNVCVLDTLLPPFSQKAPQPPQSPRGGGGGVWFNSLSDKHPNTFLH